MKKFGYVFFVLAVLLLSRGAFYAQDALAVEHEGKLSAGVYAMVVAPEKGNFDTTGGGGAYVDYRLTENLVLEGAVEYAQWDFSVDATGAATGTLTGDLDVIPLIGTLQYRFDTSESFIPYVGAGITAMLIDGDASGTLSNGASATISLDDAIGGHICGGFDYKVQENLLVNLDLKYTWAVSDTTESATAGTTVTFDDMDMHNATARIGIKYLF